MNIAVLGTGMVGQALAARLHELGHRVTVGTRDPAASLARTEPGGLGDWHAQHPDVAVAGFADAAREADLVVLAALGTAALDILGRAGAENLAGTVVLDISNPLDFSGGMPPSLFVSNTDSLGEQLQRAFPEARVVKTLNTMTAAVMVHPTELAAGDFTTFVSGDDAEAKAVVTDLLRSLGHTDVLDLGDITTARGTEMLMPIWLRLWGALGTPMLTFKVVR
ncbi:MAG TPA: NAD(P)-binding domain-containing protein [Nocardioides sp.]|uniref:NADPH-dependent F420 reductase n=1 Tax=Nocardioides sp. TaxID=35761 RepID=UPI002D1706D7|nr:NAD(P)-binding domain-containing protein [Nocardioides sp.]HQR26411.1 NAD(P)-binding domain-containing protein [Nocardioides sp.]